MNNTKKLLSFVVVSLLLQPSFVSAKKTDENIFYYFPNGNGFESVEKQYRDIDILAPQIYFVGTQLQLVKSEEDVILTLAEKKRIDVMPLVIQANFDKSLMTQLLNDEDAQDEIIDHLIEDAQKYDYIGYQYDFENINHLDREKYVDFVEKTYKAMRKKDLLFSVAVIPRTTDYDKNSLNQDWSSGYGYEGLAEHSDFLSIMSYDDPKSKGPVSSMEYLENVLSYTQRFVPDDKISLGIPLYCWQYEIGNSKKIANVTYPISAATQEKYKNYGVLSTYVDGEYETEVFLFIKPKDNSYALNIIWCDNKQSIEVKQKFAEKENLRGLSFWALGQEDPNIWDLF